MGDDFENNKIFDKKQLFYFSQRIIVL